MSKEYEIKVFFVGGLNSLCPYLEKEGVRTVSDMDNSVDIVLTGAVGKYKEVENLRKKYGFPVVQYVWDLYEWAWEGKRPNDYDWHGYGEVVKQADDIWSPNVGTQKRITEYLGMDSIVIEPHIDFYEHERKDEGYVLDHMRDYPVENEKWVEKACTELNIPFKRTMHGLSLQDYRKVVSNARLLVTPYDEASTGGLTLLEGLYNGVPSLVSNSQYSGGKEYLGKHANTFQEGDYNDFKKQLAKLYNNPPKPRARKHLKKFSPEVIAKKYKDRLCYILQQAET